MAAWAALPRRMALLWAVLLAARASALRRSQAQEGGDAPLEVSPKGAVVPQQVSHGTSPDGMVCCCKAGPCSWEAMEGGYAAEHTVDSSLFDKKKTGVHSQMCCKLTHKPMLASCPLWSGYRLKAEVQRCAVQQPANISSIASCRHRLANWLRDPVWYKALSDWKAYHNPLALVKSKREASYKSYMMCLTPKTTHVADIMLGDMNWFVRERGVNPLRQYLEELHECKGLSREGVVQAVEDSYDEVCPFAMPSLAYKPNLAPNVACTYDPLDSTIHFARATRCPEGHRCACPVFQKQGLSASNSKSYTFARYAYAVFSTVAGGGYIVGKVAAITASGALAAVGTFLTAWSWPLTVAAGAIGLAVYGTAMLAQWVRFTCDRNVGCYPMECVLEPGVGCRINPTGADSDFRNPFWFLPPPMYKCGLNSLGRCALQTCTAEDLKDQHVGTVEATRWWGNRSQVYNCQPMLAADMLEEQRITLAKRVEDLRKEVDTVQRRMRKLRRAMEADCPWSRATVKAGVITCKDASSCKATLTHQDCCDKRRGIQQCPPAFPIMCADGRCDDILGQCKKHNGTKACPAADACAWLLPVTQNNIIQCNDGTFHHTKAFDYFKTEYNKRTQSVPWCAGHKGLLKCPWNKPTMCANRTCKGEYCCQEDCTKFGGPRNCEASAHDNWPVKPEQSFTDRVNLVPTIDDKPTGEEESTGKCPAMCDGGLSCDEWLSANNRSVMTCSLLEDLYGCNCTGCACPVHTNLIVREPHSVPRVSLLQRGGAGRASGWSPLLAGVLVLCLLRTRRWAR